MKPSDVISGLATAVEAAAVAQSRPEDKLRRISSITDWAQGGQERTFLLMPLTLPNEEPELGVGCSNRQFELELAILYGDASTSIARLADDAELVTDILWGTIAAMPQVVIREMETSVDPDRVESAVLAVWTMRVKYAKD